jgi:hypothetical protein
MNSDETDTRSRSPASKYNDSRLRNRDIHSSSQCLQTRLASLRALSPRQGRLFPSHVSLFLAGRFGFSCSLFLVCGAGVWRIKSVFLRVHHIPTIPTREALWALFIHSSRHGFAVVIYDISALFPWRTLYTILCGSLFGALSRPDRLMDCRRVSGVELYALPPPATRCVLLRARPNHGVTEAILLRVLEFDFPEGGYIQSEKREARKRVSDEETTYTCHTREGRGRRLDSFLHPLSRSAFTHCGILYDTATTVNASKRKTLMINISVAIDVLV